MANFRFAVLLWTLVLLAGPAAAAPGEVAGVEFGDGTTLEWVSTPGAEYYNIYRGAISDPSAPGRCHAFEIGATSHALNMDPGPGEGFVFLVTAEHSTHGEGPPGTDSNSGPRVLLGSCGSVMRTHVLDRLGYGWSEWARDRVDALGLEGYVTEQLDPLFIDESTNTELNDRLALIDPPADIVQLVQHRVIRATYARRQLEQQAAAFWANHFNTDWTKVTLITQLVFPPCQLPGNPPQCDPDYPVAAQELSSNLLYNEIQTFRSLAFTGTFRDIVEASALSPAMILYLDTYLSELANPNENYPRELLELHALGVTGGYTQGDVEELSRVITGWTFCKKESVVLDACGSDTNSCAALAPCIGNYWLPTPEGRWVARFVPGLHDCTEKILFAGTPQETTISDTCANPEHGVQDLYEALDAIVAHPATAEFISTKLLQRFITDDPEPVQVAQIVSAWNDLGNPQGVGDLLAVLEALLDPQILLDPDGTGSKIKTPLEQAVSAFRGTRGKTDGATGVIGLLVAAQHIPHYNPVPTGWPEDGASWIGTNNTLERQNFGLILAASISEAFGTDVIDLLQDHGVSTDPGNAPAIVDFMSDIFFGGALTPAERQAAIDYLETDDAGVPSPYTLFRVRDAVGFMLGYPQFQEQ